MQYRQDTTRLVQLSRARDSYLEVHCCHRESDRDVIGGSDQRSRKLFQQTIPAFRGMAMYSSKENVNALDSWSVVGGSASKVIVKLISIIKNLINHEVREDEELK
jgi:hypothetical protein